MTESNVDASGFLEAPIELVRELVGHYGAGGHDLDAMRQIVSFVLSELGERTLTAQLTHRPSMQLGSISLTVEEAKTRIADLRALPLFHLS